MRILRYIATAEDDGRAVRSVAPRRFSLGTHAFRRLKAQGGILVNGERAHADRLVREGDVIELHLSSPNASPAGFAGAPDLQALPPSFIRYRDADLLIVAKGAPLATLPSIHQRTGTLREQLAAMLGQECDAFVYHPVNRLDKGTSGLLCVALHAHAQRLLAAQLHTGAFSREYLAVTDGAPPKDEGVIDAPIARTGQGARRAVMDGGQCARTHYRVEARGNGHALVRLWLETGRTHQIRVHLASLGCPVAGDYLYGRPMPELGGRFALHSTSLSLVQPVTGEAIRIEEPLPAELAALLRA